MNRCKTFSAVLLAAVCAAVCQPALCMTIGLRIAAWTSASGSVIEPSVESELEDILGDAGKVESDGAGGWIVTLTNDVAAANLPLEIPDDLGGVTIDLNGHDLVGGDGRDGVRPSQDAGEDGKPAIRIVPGGGGGESTVLTVVTTGGDALVKGGDGGAGNPCGNGAPAIEVADGTEDGVSINIGEGVTVQGGGVPAINGMIGENNGNLMKVEVPVPAIASKEYTSGQLQADISATDVYTVQNDGGVDAGNYPVTLTLTDSTNYRWKGGDSNPLNLTFAITKASNSWLVQPSISGWTYGQGVNMLNMGSAKFGTVQVSYSATPQNVGSYTATFTVAGTANYEGLTKEVPFTIAKATYDMSGARWSAGSFTYDGTEKSVVVEGLPSGVSVQSYANNAKTAAGNYTATVALNYDSMNYNAPTMDGCNWSIAKKNIAGATVTLGPALVYNGLEQEQTVTGVKIDGLDATYTVSGNTATEAGTYTLTVTGTGNFTGTETKQWRISSDGIVEAVTPYDAIYDGEGHGILVSVTKPEVATVKYSGSVDGPYTDDAILFTNVTEEAITVWYTVEAANYTTVTNSGTVKISPKSLTEEMVSVEDASYTYDGTAKEPTVTVADGEPSIMTDDDYVVAYSNNVEVGTADVVVTGMRNYAGTVVRHFTIAPVGNEKLVDAFGELPGTFEPGEGGWIVTITNDIDSASLPVEIPDNFGGVTIDLKGHDLVGGDGNPAISIVPGEGDGEPTVLTVISTGGDATIQGGSGAPAIEVDDDARDGVLINIGEGVTVRGGDDFTPAIVGEVGTNDGTIVDPNRFHIPGAGTVTVPKTWKTGQKVTWKATAAKGSVFAHWEGPLVESMGLSRNELRNPSLAFAVPVGFETNQITAVFISVDDDRLGTLALSLPGPLAPNADVAGLELVDDSESYVTASASGLPTGLKFDAKTLAVTGKPTKPGVYTVKITAKNASGYQWAENIGLRVADIDDARIDVGGLPETGAVGEAYAGKIAAGEFKTLSASGLPAGLKLDTKSGAVAGIPTKGGWFTVTVTVAYPDKSKATATRLLTISPVAIAEPKRTAYYPLTVVSTNAAEGTVTGTGVYAEGKKVSISAKPAKGYVFAGWYADPSLSRPATFAAGDFRKASQSVVVPGMRYAFARFVTVEDDTASITLSMDGVSCAAGASPSYTNYCGVAVDWPLAADALSEPTVKATGLPAGVKLVQDKATGAYSLAGAPTAASKKNKDGSLAPSKVKLTVTTAGKSSQAYEFYWTILPLPEWAVGTFDGTGNGEWGTGNGEWGTGEVAGLVTLTVAANGKISGKIIDDAGTWTLSAASYSAVECPASDVEGAESSPVFYATVIGKNGKMAVTNELEVSAEEVRRVEDAAPCQRGVVTSGEWTAWQNLWKTEPWNTDAKPFAKASALAIDAGTRDACPYSGTITLKFAASGAVTASGKFVTGQDSKGKNVVYSASCSSVLVPEADAAGAGCPPYRVFLYFPPKAGKFEGYADEMQLVWDGAAFSLSEQ